MDIDALEYKYDTMLNEDLAKFIDSHNKWRRYRGDHNEPMCCPKELGMALDHVVLRLNSYAMREHKHLEQSLAEHKAMVGRIAEHASNYIGCSCNKGDCDAGDCWGCRMMEIIDMCNLDEQLQENEG